MHAQTRTLPSDADSTGRNFGNEEIENLKAVLASGTLNCTKGQWVKHLETDFAKIYGVKYARAVTSGTSAIHAAIAAIDPEPGDEIITTSITDMGAISPIIYQSAIPIFAEVDPETYNVTAATIEPKITKRTKAIIVTHLFGNPCDMDPILALGKKYKLPIIEDAAQAYLTEYKGKLIGTLGDIGCFSLQQGKHMTSGEGGLVLAKDEKYQRRITLFVDKAWGYGDKNPDHYFLALNYRMTELQGAVALAQLHKLQQVVNARIEKANKLTKLIQGIRGIETPKLTPNSKHVYWKYCLRVDPQIIEGGVIEFSKCLKEEGIFSAPRYIQKPAFMCEVLRDKKTFGNSQFPFVGEHRKGLPPVEYKIEDYPKTQEALNNICVLPWNENYTDEDVQYIANAVIKTAEKLRKKS
jgi:perosamine synthetase